MATDKLRLFGSVMLKLTPEQSAKLVNLRPEGSMVLTGEVVQASTFEKKPATLRVLGVTRRPIHVNPAPAADEVVGPTWLPWSFLSEERRLEVELADGTSEDIRGMFPRGKAWVVVNAYFGTGTIWAYAEA